MRIMGFVVLSIFPALVLASCASIPLKTVYNLWNFDPWTSDFRVWRAAVRIPEGRGIDLTSARVTMKVETWREGEAARQAEVFVLERSLDAADIAPLATERRAGFALAAYRFAPGDHTRLETLRTRIVTARKSDRPVKGALSISANACHGPRSAAAADGGFPISTYLMVDRQDGYNPLVVDHDLGPELRKAAKSGEDICKAGE